MFILFLHGWQSVTGGVKPTFLAQNGHTVFEPQLPCDEFPAALSIGPSRESDSNRGAAALGLD